MVKTGKRALLKIQSQSLKRKREESAVNTERGPPVQHWPTLLPLRWLEETDEQQTKGKWGEEDDSCGKEHTCYLHSPSEVRWGKIRCEREVATWPISNTHIIFFSIHFLRPREVYFELHDQKAALLLWIDANTPLCKAGLSLLENCQLPQHAVPHQYVPAEIPSDSATTFIAVKGFIHVRPDKCCRLKTSKHCYYRLFSPMESVLQIGGLG